MRIEWVPNVSSSVHCITLDAFCGFQANFNSSSIEMRCCFIQRILSTPYIFFHMWILNRITVAFAMQTRCLLEWIPLLKLRFDNVKVFQSAVDFPHRCYRSVTTIDEMKRSLLLFIQPIHEPSNDRNQHLFFLCKIFDIHRQLTKNELDYFDILLVKNTHTHSTHAFEKCIDSLLIQLLNSRQAFFIYWKLHNKTTLHTSTSRINAFIIRRVSSVILLHLSAITPWISQIKMFCESKYFLFASRWRKKWQFLLPRFLLSSRNAVSTINPKPIRFSKWKWKWNWNDFFVSSSVGALNETHESCKMYF